MKRAMVIAAAAALFLVPALAQDDTPVAADAKLNAAYQALMGRLKSDPDGQDLLRKSERAWLQYRDAECNWEGHNPSYPQPDAVRGCIVDKTLARARQFENWPDY